MLDTLAEAAGSPAFVGPDQDALQQLLSAFDPTEGGF
jgi:hypothetical protein